MQLQLEAELTLETCKHFLCLLHITFKNKCNVKYMHKIAINNWF